MPYCGSIYYHWSMGDGARLRALRYEAKRVDKWEAEKARFAAARRPKQEAA